jgi:hypothetical protein
MSRRGTTFERKWRFLRSTSKQIQCVSHAPFVVTVEFGQEEPADMPHAVAIAAACIAVASPARPQSRRQPPAPEIEEGRAWLDRKAAERERAFQLQRPKSGRSGGSTPIVTQSARLDRDG